jgi:hypothetical protein
MHKEIAFVALILILSLSSCGLKKTQVDEGMQVVFKESSFCYYIPGEPGALIKQHFVLELSSPAQNLRLDSLELPYGMVVLKQSKPQGWEGFMFWNFVNEAKANNGDSAVVYGSKEGLLVSQVISIRRNEDIYLPSEAPH